jgi:hypothetical protein
MFFTFIWFIFIAYSVTRYQKTFLTFSSFIGVPWRWSLLSCAGSHHFTQFGSWSGAAKVVHLKSGRTATPDLFRLFLPNHLDNGNNDNNDVCRYEQRQNERARTCTMMMAPRNQTATTTTITTTENKRTRTRIHAHHNDNGTTEEPRWHGALMHRSIERAIFNGEVGQRVWGRRTENGQALGAWRVCQNTMLRFAGHRDSDVRQGGQAVVCGVRGNRFVHMACNL